MEKASRQNYHFIQAEKHRLDLVIISFLAFHFCTMIAETYNTAHPFNTAVYCTFFSLLLESRKLVICEPGIGARMIYDLTRAKYLDIK